MSDDLFPAAEPSDIPIGDQIDCVERELRYRERVYQRRVDAGKMSAELAERELLRMRAVLDTLRALQERPA